MPKLILTLVMVPCALLAQGIQPPPGAKLVLRAHATGDQIYTCQHTASAFAWSPKGPDARLTDDRGHAIGRHFAGPTWQLNDGSQVVGRPVAHADAPEPNAVPWLSLTVVSETGHGQLEQVHTVQRVNTHGGQPPAGGCDAAHVGQDVRVPYTAQYDFYS
jgi:Protein of unknown function (DUF3455)